MFLQYSAVHGSLLLFYFTFLQYTGFSCFYNAALATCHLPILQFLNSHCVKAAQKSPFLILSLQQNPLVKSRQCAFWWVMLAKRSRERKKRLGLVNQDHKYKALFLHCLHLPPQLPGTWYGVKKEKKSGDKESHGAACNSVGIPLQFSAENSRWTQQFQRLTTLYKFPLKKKSLNSIFQALPCLNV